MQQRRDATIEKVRVKTQAWKSTTLGSIIIAYCAFVICKVSKHKRTNNATVHAGHLDWCVNCALMRMSSGHLQYKVAVTRLFLSMGPSCKQSNLESSSRGGENSVKAVSSRGGGPQSGCRSGTWHVLRPQRDFASLPQKRLIKTREPFHFSSPLLHAYSLCLTRDRMTARSPRLSFNHIQIVCYVQFNFLRILPRNSSDGFKAGLMQRWTLIRLQNGGAV